MVSTEPAAAQGYDLFHTTGVKPSLKERLLSALEQEA
jgi:hypothetical protein